MAGAAAILLLAAGAAACAESAAQGARTPADRAAFMERTRCLADDDDKALAPVLGGSAVQDVQPLYSALGGRSGPQSELRGVTLTIAALPGMTAEWLDRALECHGAKATLGHAPAASDDPFLLPGSALDIDVRTAKDGFDAAITGYSPDDARQILARATAFKARTAGAAK